MEKLNKKNPKTLHKVYFDTPLTFTKAKDDDEDALIIEGYASTKDIDRTSDIIEASAWRKRDALKGYKKNPIILAFHRHDKPIGRAELIEHSENGLTIKARISKAAGDVYDLIKEGILSTFSVGIIVNELDYDQEKDVFLIKNLELLEISVVSVPANPYATFRVSKGFENQKEFEEFKNTFKQEINTEEKSIMTKEVENKSTVEAPAVDVDAITKSVLAALDAKQKAEEAAKAAENARISEVTTAAERIVADLRKEFEDKDKNVSEVLTQMRDELKAREAEIVEMKKAQKSKMHYVEGGAGKGNISEVEMDTAILVAKSLRKGLTETKYFDRLVEKSGREHWDAGAQTAWEEEFSTRIHNEMRESLIIENMFTSIPMNAPTMYMPVNPEAGYGEWIQDNMSPNLSNFLRSENPRADEVTGTSSTGDAVDHQLTENVIKAYKLATKEYVGYEEEEDSIVALMPVIRDAIARRMARSADKALLRGAGANGDPIAGLAALGTPAYDVTKSVATLDVTDTTIADFITLRKNLGIYGLDPAGLVWVVSHELYYHMMGFAEFLTIDKIGDRATLRTGQVGAMLGSPVVVSQQFDNTNIVTPANGAVYGLLVRPTNFVKGELRGMRVEGDRDVINQKNVLVATRRFGFKDLDAGQGVAKFRFVA